MVRHDGELRAALMVLEIATIDIKDGLADEFEAAVSKAAPIFRRAKGCRSVNLERSIENPLSYRLLVRWDTIENHTIDFQKSTDFMEWRRLVGHCFAAMPKVDHTRCAVALDLRGQQVPMQNSASHPKT